MTSLQSEPSSEPLEPPERTYPRNSKPVSIPQPPMPSTQASSSLNSLPTSSPDLHHSQTEEDDETSSETHEPVTPVSDGHPQSYNLHSQQHGAGLDGAIAVVPTVAPVKPQTLLVQSPPTPASKTTQTPKTRPTPISRQSTTSKLSRFFHRKTPEASHGEQDGAAASSPPKADIPRAASDNAMSPAPRHFSISKSANTSPVGSIANSPPKGGSPNTTIAGTTPELWLTPSGGDASPKRSSTGLKENVGRIVFSLQHKEQRPKKKRSTSMTGAPFFKPDNSISIPAAAGVGLKARRMSTSLPDDFTVDTVELNTEYTSTSVIPGRRGKTLGKGATASVKLMALKGSTSEKVFAIKEFRKKSQEEDEGEYEKKVKSEYTIAKSLHHPNIVETFRLCTHSGRWNHVMEYVPLEVYSLVEKKYFKEEDNNCIFKQLVRGVAHLHTHGIAHRDIKLENMLMTLDGQIKITDFGVSEVFCGEHPGVRASGGECGKNMKEVRRSAPGICGSLPYIAPEVIEKKGDYDPRPLDVWSCAIVHLTMRYGGAIWPKAEAAVSPTYADFQKGWRVWLSKHPDPADQRPVNTSDLPKCGPPFGLIRSLAEKRTMLRMLHPDPLQRVTIAEVLEENWVKNIDCCAPIDTPEDGAGSGEGSATGAGTLDATRASCCRKAAKQVRKMHNHLPPNTTKIPGMSFHLREGRNGE